MSNTFTKIKAFAVIGYNYISTPHCCAVFDCYKDAQDYINNQDDGWTYEIEGTFFLERNLPF